MSATSTSKRNSTFSWIIDNRSVLLWLIFTSGLFWIILRFSTRNENIMAVSDSLFPARMFLFSFIIIATLFPIIMYFLFTRRQYPKIQATFIKEVLLLDPKITTKEQAEEKYLSRLEETFGLANGTEGVLRSLPLFICTVLLLMGWVLVLQPFNTEAIKSRELLLLPYASTVNFAFLGAYFFTINLTFKRYVRSDLTPKTYSHIIIRLILAVILALLLEVVFKINPITPDGKESLTVSTAILYLFAFFVGFFPETGLALIKDLADNKLLNKMFPRLEEEHPLTRLEGINLYDRTRFMEEGIENVENLAHSSLISLMLSTRIPTNRLVDLFDQAILYIHLGPDKDAEKCARDQLRCYGIRTATDLEAAAQDAKATANDFHDYYHNFLMLLDKNCNMDSSVSKLKTILATLSDDDWMSYLRKWREFGKTC